MVQLSQEKNSTVTGMTAEGAFTTPLRAPASILCRVMPPKDEGTKRMPPMLSRVIDSSDTEPFRPEPEEVYSTIP